MNPKIKKILSYSGSVYFVQLINIFSIFIIPGYLQPIMMGKFNLLQVIYGYMDYTHLGLRYSLDKEIPANIAQNNHDEIEKITKTGISAILFITIIIDILIFCIAPFVPNIDYDILLGIYIICPAVTVYIAFNNLKIVMRAHEKVTLMAKVVMVYGLLWVVLRIFGTIIAGFYGLLLSMLVANIIGLLFILKYSEHSYTLNIDFSRLKYLFKTGLPFFSSNIFYVIFCSLDKWVIATFLGFKQLGYYAIANMILYFLYVLPTSVGEVLFPGLLKKITGTKEDKIVSDYLSRYIKITSKLVAILLGSIIIFIPFLINYFLKAYIPGISSAQILILACYSVFFQGLFSYYLYGVNKCFFLFSSYISGIITFALINLGFYIFNQITIQNVSISMVISAYVISYSEVIYSFKNLQLSFFTILKTVIYSLIPLYAVGVAFIISYTFKYTYSNFFQDYIILSIAETVFIISCIPLIIRVKKSMK